MHLTLISLTDKGQDTSAAKVGTTEVVKNQAVSDSEDLMSRRRSELELGVAECLQLRCQLVCGESHEREVGAVRTRQLVVDLVQAELVQVCRNLPDRSRDELEERRVALQAPIGAAIERLEGEDRERIELTDALQLRDARELVDVPEQCDSVLGHGLQLTTDGVPGLLLPLPSGRVRRGVVHHDREPVGDVLKQRQVVTNVQRFRTAGERPPGFRDDEAIHVGRQVVESHPQEAELIVDWHRVDHKPLTWHSRILSSRRPHDHSLLAQRAGRSRRDSAAFSALDSPSMDPETTRTTILSISQCIPFTDIDHGGGRFVAQLDRSWATFADVTWVVPDTPENRDGITREGAPSTVLLVGRSGSRAPWSRAFSWLLYQAQRRRKDDPTAPSLTMSARLVLDKRLRNLVRDADVVDLQWLEQIRLEPLIRRLNRRAWLVGTFHDSTSQAFRRRAESAAGDQASLWERRSRDVARIEAVSAASLDMAVTFSEKDSLVIDPTGTLGVTVLAPAQQIAGIVPRHPTPHPTCIFVGHFGRSENVGAVEWMLDRVWPTILESHPCAELLLVGPGASEDLKSKVSAVDGARFTGFVPDLGALLGSAWCSVAPLQLGGGVKFKTVEALLAGTPTVATSVGAEGIAPAEALAGVHDDPDEFAVAVARVLDAPAEAADHLASRQEELQEHYGWPAFDREVRRIYTPGSIDRRTRRPQRA